MAFQNLKPSFFFSPKFEFFENYYENTRRKKEAGKNIRKSRLFNKFALRWLSLSKPPHLV